LTFDSRGKSELGETQATEGSDCPRIGCIQRFERHVRELKIPIAWRTCPVHTFKTTLYFLYTVKFVHHTLHGFRWAGNNHIQNGSLLWLRLNHWWCS